MTFETASSDHVESGGCSDQESGCLVPVILKDAEGSEAPSGRAVEVSFETVQPGTGSTPATEGEDYEGTSGILTFSPGKPGTTSTW